MSMKIWMIVMKICRVPVMLLSQPKHNDNNQFLVSHTAYCATTVQCCCLWLNWFLICVSVGLLKCEVTSLTWQKTDDQSKGKEGAVEHLLTTDQLHVDARFKTKYNMCK